MGTTLRHLVAFLSLFLLVLKVLDLHKHVTHRRQKEDEERKKIKKCFFNPLCAFRLSISFSQVSLRLENVFHFPNLEMENGKYLVILCFHFTCKHIVLVSCSVLRLRFTFIVSTLFVSMWESEHDSLSISFVVPLNLMRFHFACSIFYPSFYFSFDCLPFLSSLAANPSLIPFLSTFKFFGKHILCSRIIRAFELNGNTIIHFSILCTNRSFYSVWNYCQLVNK